MSISIGQIAAPAVHGVSGASAPMPPSTKMAALFDKIDTSGQGSIDKSQLESAFQTLKPPRGFKQMGADALFSQLDSSGTGSVSKQAFVQKMTGMMSQFRNSATSPGAAAPDPANTLSQSLMGFNALGGNLELSA